jgi:hypothetical protein
MAKVRLLTSMAGIDFSHNKGDVIDCSDEAAARYIEAGIAEGFADAEAKVERAVKKTAVEKAVKE